MAEFETRKPKEAKKIKKSGSSGKRRLRLGARTVVSYALIAAGLALILFAGLYALVDYPWQILFYKPETFKTDTLPDPEPPVLDGAVVTYNPAAVAATPAPPLVRAPNGAQEDLPGADLPESPTPSRGPAVVCQVIGAVKIPKLGLSVNLMDDVTQTHLRLGAGFVRGTALPGRPGNCSVAGHRVTARMHPFRYLDKMVAGDYVFVKYEEHTYVYETTETFVVSNQERWVMDPVPSETYLLTLITCHPVGSARQRLILRARLIEIDGMTPEAFYTPETQAILETPETDVPADPNAPPAPDAPPGPNTSVDPSAPPDPNASVDPSAPADPNASVDPNAPPVSDTPAVDLPSDRGGVPQTGATPGAGPPETPEGPPETAASPPGGDALSAGAFE